MKPVTFSMYPAHVVLESFKADFQRHWIDSGLRQIEFPLIPFEDTINIIERVIASESHDTRPVGSAPEMLFNSPFFLGWPYLNVWKKPHVHHQLLEYMINGLSKIQHDRCEVCSSGAGTWNQFPLVAFYLNDIEEPKSI